jgi:hypothetical protein
MKDSAVAATGSSSVGIGMLIGALLGFALGIYLGWEFGRLALFMGLGAAVGLTAGAYIGTYLAPLRHWLKSLVNRLAGLVKVSRRGKGR